MTAGQGNPALSAEEFSTISQTVYRASGIVLRGGKEELVRSRLSRRLRELEFDSFQAYLSHVERDRTGHELSTMIDLLTTNKTSFFRESKHFDFLVQQLLPGWMQSGRPCRLWSAGCSSGEEPYSLGMLLRSRWSNIDAHDVRILATDLCEKILATARQAIYPAALTATVPKEMTRFLVTRTGEGGTDYEIHPDVRRLVVVARLNLLDAWPVKGPFQAIFCRNVMIYFDRSTQLGLAERFCQRLVPGGCLFVGHSESLGRSVRGLEYVCPGVYRRGEARSASPAETTKSVGRGS